MPSWNLARGACWMSDVRHGQGRAVADRARMRRPRRRARSFHGGHCARPRHQRRGGDVRELGSKGPDLRPDRLRAGVALGGPHARRRQGGVRCCSRGDGSACSGIAAGPTRTLSARSTPCTRGLPQRSRRPTSRSIRGTSRRTGSMSSESGRRVHGCRSAYVPVVRRSTTGQAGSTSSPPTATTSACPTLARRALLDAVADAVDALGGTMTYHYSTLLVLATRGI